MSRRGRRPGAVAAVAVIFLAGFLAFGFLVALSLEEAEAHHKPTHTRGYVTTTAPPPPPSTTAPPPAPPPPESCEPPSYGCFENPPPPPDASWRPYMDTSAWNRGTAGASTHPNSAAMVTYLRGFQVQNIVVGPLGREYGDGAALYFADTDDPVYRIHCTQWTSSCEIEGALVRIPAGAKPTPGPWDMHMTVVQADGWEYDFWQSATPSGFGGTLDISHGGRTRIDGDSTGSNATGALTGAPAGEIRSTQWIAGTINHAIGLAVFRTRAVSSTCPVTGCASVYPVRGDDCLGHLTSTDPASPIPLGQWFKLDVTDAEIAAQPPWRRSIYRALRDYGGFVIDTGGSGFAYHHANEMIYGSWGRTDPAHPWLLGQPDVVVDSAGRAVARTPAFPWDRLVALNPPPAALPCP